MKKKGTVVSKVVLLAMLPVMVSVPVTASAQVKSKNTFYIGAGPGLSKVEPDTGGTIYSVSDSHSSGGKLYLGYDFSDRLSLEGYYSDLGKADISPTGSIGYKDMGVSGVFYFYKPERTREKLSAFLRAGIGRMKNDTSLNYERKNDSHFMLGTGVEYGLKNGFALRADLDLYDADAQLFTISLLKRFGGSEAVEKKEKPAPITKPIPEPNPEPAIVDSDHDGVLDGNDKCPGTAAGVTVDASGCKLQQVLVLEGVTFALDSAELVGDSHSTLDEVADSLKRNPDQRVEVVGYTDSRGNAAYNKGLSQRRANAVRDYLIEQGVKSENLKARGYGEKDPIADNSTAEGRAKNRRVEMHLLK